MGCLEDLKVVLRENDIPFFTDEELEFYLNMYGDYELTSYRLLLRKAENTTLNLSGLSLSDTQSYFRRLSLEYRPRNSGVLKGGY